MCEYCDEVFGTLEAELESLRRALLTVSKVAMDKPITNEDVRCFDSVVGRSVMSEYKDKIESGSR